MTEQQLPEAVRWLLEQQELVRAPKREPLPTPITSGGSMATVLVAAADASLFSKSKADFQCLGSDDQVVIRRAILAAGQWGTVWLSEGFYDCNLDAAICLTTYGNIRGLGRGPTFISVTGSSSATDVFVDLGDHSQLADLTIEGAGGVDAALVKMTGNSAQIVNASVRNGNSIGWGVWVTGDIDPSIIDRCYIVGDQAAVRASAGFNLSIVNSYLEGSAVGLDASNHGGFLYVAGNRIDAGTGILATAGDMRIQNNLIVAIDDPAISLQDAERAMISDNQITGNPTRGVLAVDCDDIAIVDNIIRNCDGAAVHLTGSTRPRVEGNQLFNCNTDPMDTAAVVIDGTGAAIPARGFRVVDNEIEATNAKGIHILDGYLHGKCDGNKIIRVREHGIWIVDLKESSICDNLVAWADNLSGTASWDGIILAGDSDRNSIQDNTIVAEIPAGGPAARYGINISAATCNDNVWNDNYVYVTANLTGGAYNNAGTATQGTNFNS